MKTRIFRGVGWTWELAQVYPTRVPQSPGRRRSWADEATTDGKIRAGAPADAQGPSTGYDRESPGGQLTCCLGRDVRALLCTGPTMRSAAAWGGRPGTAGPARAAHGAPTQHRAERRPYAVTSAPPPLVAGR